MNKEAANIEIAKRVGWQAKQIQCGTGQCWTVTPPDIEDGKEHFTSESAAWCIGPDYFSERDDAADLLDWFASLDEFAGLQLRFVNALCRNAGFNAQNTSIKDLLTLVRVKPRQIANAACEAFGVELDMEDVCFSCGLELSEGYCAICGEFN